MKLIFTCSNSQVTQHNILESIETTVECSRANSQIAKDGINDIQKRVQENAHQLQSVERRIVGVLDTVNSRMDRTEWIVKDCHQDVSAKLTLIQNDTHSMSDILRAGVVEILEKMAEMEKRKVVFFAKHVIKDDTNVKGER